MPSFQGKYLRWWPLPDNGDDDDDDDDGEREGIEEKGSGGGKSCVEVSFTARASEDVRVCLAPPLSSLSSSLSASSSSSESVEGGQGVAGERGGEGHVVEEERGCVLEVVLGACGNAVSTLSIGEIVVAKALQASKELDQVEEGGGGGGGGVGVCDPTDFVAVRIQTGSMEERGGERGCWFVRLFVSSSLDPSLPLLAWKSEGAGGGGTNTTSATTTATATSSPPPPPPTTTTTRSTATVAKKRFSQFSLTSGGASRVFFRNIHASVITIEAGEKAEKETEIEEGVGVTTLDSYHATSTATTSDTAPADTNNGSVVAVRRRNDLLEHVVGEDNSNGGSSSNGYFDYGYSGGGGGGGSSAEALLMARPSFSILAGQVPDSSGRSANERRRSSGGGGGGRRGGGGGRRDDSGGSASGGGGACVGALAWLPATSFAELRGQVVAGSWSEAQVLTRLGEVVKVLETLYARKLVLDLVLKGPPGTLTAILKAATAEAAAAPAAAAAEAEAAAEAAAGAAGVTAVEEVLKAEEVAGGKGSRGRAVTSLPFASSASSAASASVASPLHLMEALLMLTVARGNINDSFLQDLGQAVVHEPSLWAHLVGRAPSHLAAASLQEFDDHPWAATAASSDGGSGGAVDVAVSDSLLLCLPPVALVEWLTELQLLC
jgi:hypothetical protein